MEAILALIRLREELEPFSASPPVAITRLLVLKHSLASPLATRIRPLELKRSRTTPATATRPMVFKRSLKAQLASSTWLLGGERSLATPLATKIQPMVIKRSTTTPPAA